MASKYAGLQKVIPSQPTEYALDVQDHLNALANKDLAFLTAQHNKRSDRVAEIAKEDKKLKAEIKALEVLILQKLDALEGDAITINGRTWSPKPEPYPVCEDPAAIIKYFEDNGMADQLALSNTELAARLKDFVKNEAQNNELIIEEKTVVDPDTGEEKVVREVRSHIEGVRVFLKSGLTRPKSSKGAV